jgi:putative Mg2+ transporter-C (MgtC) family protein
MGGASGSCTDGFYQLRHPGGALKLVRAALFGSGLRFPMDILQILLGNLRHWMPPPLAPLALVAVSVVCGSIVGAERERAEKPAGLRTLLLICLGSTVFTLMSIDEAIGAADRARIAAQIVTGVGFLGAGAILRERGGVVGLTTAASIWVVAAVGIVVGAGYAVAGLALSGAIVATLSLLSRIENRFLEACEMATLRLVVHPDHGKTWLRIQGILDEFGNPVSATVAGAPASNEQAIELRYCRSHRHHRAFFPELAKLPEILAVEPAVPSFISRASRWRPPEA